MQGILFGAGRIGRLHYFFWVLGLGAAMLAVASLITPDGIQNINDTIANRFLAYLPLLWLSCAAATRRAHDRNHTGWFVVLLFVPVVNVAATLYLLLTPSFSMPNKWGAPAWTGPRLSDAERAEAQATLEAEQAEAVRLRDEGYLDDEGHFDMDGLYQENTIAGEGTPPSPPQPPA